MEFLADNAYPEGTFTALLKSIQRLYPIILSLSQAHTLEVEQEMPEITKVVPVGADIDDISHAFSRCAASRVILSELFGMNHWYEYDGLPGLDNMVFKVISIGGGYGFPDHTFVTIEYGNYTYILQTYYFGYSLAGKYGVIKLDKAEATNLNRIFADYRSFMGSEFTPYAYLMRNSIEIANNELSRYTGIDPRRHHGNMSLKHGPNFISIRRSCANGMAVFNHLQRKIDFFKYIMCASITRVEQTMELLIQYEFADAFNVDTHPSFSMLHTDGNFVGTLVRHREVNTDVATDSLFGYLTGFNNAGVVHGVRLGHRINAEGQTILPFQAEIAIPFSDSLELFMAVSNNTTRLLVEESRENMDILRNDIVNDAIKNKLSQLMTYTVQLQYQKVIEVTALLPALAYEPDPIGENVRNSPPPHIPIP